ncbi:MAG: hypothetical protein R3C49_21140 [Planctomycetaceae bacterium]
MRRILFTRWLPLTVLLMATVLSTKADLTEPQKIDDKATHQQVAIVKLKGDGKELPVNAFCLNQAGQIVAACGTGPGQIRIANDDGDVLQAWDIDAKPEAISVAPDGSILVGGEGKLFRYSSSGELLQQADSPHAASLRESKEKLREEALTYLKRPRMNLASMISTYERILSQLEEKQEKSKLNDQEERMLKALPQVLERYRDLAEAEKEKEADDEKENEPTEEAIQQQIENLMRSKMKVSSICSDKQNVYVATRGISGYGYVVWKMDTEFSGGEVIVKDLRGCCGQMDVQCCSNGLFVAENSRHRVVRYDADGTEVTTWGKQDRTGVDGFSSCCNPMNVCFNAANEVFTAESGTGRIKRFDADGNFLSYVGDVELVPGCKNVSIAVSPDSSRVYMLDLTRNHIVVMKVRADQSEDKPLKVGQVKLRAVRSQSASAPSIIGD